MDELRLAHEHLVFKWTSMDPNVKCSKIIVSVNVETVTPVVIATITEQLWEILPVYGLVCAGQASGTAGANWVAAKDIIATRSVQKNITDATKEKYPGIDFNVRIIWKDPVTKRKFIFIPRMPYLTKKMSSQYVRSRTQKKNGP